MTNGVRVAGAKTLSKYGYDSRCNDVLAQLLKLGLMRRDLKKPSRELYSTEVMRSGTSG
jgi:hypothetical protein